MRPLTMTPKLKLSEPARNVLLFCMSKSFLPGMYLRIGTSTKMTHEPMLQAIGQHERLASGRWRAERTWMVTRKNGTVPASWPE